MRAKYVLAEVLVGLWRNVTMTVAMIITMIVSLTMLGASLLMYLQVDEMKGHYYEQVEVSIYLDKGVAEDKIAAIKAQLDSDPLVKPGGVIYEDQAMAYENFKEQFHDTPDLVAAIGPTELPASFRVSLKDPQQFEQINTKYAGLDGVDNVVDQQKLLQKIFDILGSIQTMSLVVAGAMGIAALLLVANTIQVAAYSKRREVAVMKLVGASNWFIQAPFVLEAVFAAVLGSLLAYGMLVIGKIVLIDHKLAALTDLLLPVSWGNVNLMLPILAGIGSVVSAVTAWVTLRFYIRV
ncbi:permease-like cell division protein FtsX [Catellatospora tritici]|uniref:permease-like cell division protein FtsX n=1 Tax=Catellatospora tritici TaxID=2851566 RepID=UPI001C2CEADE|nr:permease-like cell division protein FtsX [Catellatospora tritici]MBV1849456.1 permease-like cell division protein FtsX [Catellatospora tritici]MBV1854028.1 permease-like cell division protein FtsX [Catellatospora tritici]